MKTLSVLATLIILIQLTTGLAGSAPAPATLPRVFLLDPAHLFHVKLGLSLQDPSVVKLRRDAEKTLAVTHLSVVEKSKTPPSGDKHDYMSQSRYSWPNPKTANGLPYVNRDGHINPEILKITDEENLGRMVSSVETLSLAYYLIGDEKYAGHASELIRAWFLDPETAMNPNLKFAGYVPGVNNGSPGGVLQGRDFSRVIDAMGLLEGSKSWTFRDQTRMQGWFAEYSKWLTESDQGKKEAAAANNHGSWYDVQAASIALFLDRKAEATAILKQSTFRRIATQIEPDGRQPLELARTKSWDYSIFNLQPLFAVAALGERVGLDIWHFQTHDGRSIRVALDYLIEHQDSWPPPPYKQEILVNTKLMIPLLRLAAIKYCNSGYYNKSERTAEANGLDPQAIRENILYPRLATNLCSPG